MMTTNRMPAAFFGHGSPMNALERNRFTNAWRAFGAGVPEKPRAILCVSAHWFIQATAVTAMAAPRTIHDFFGFPRPLFDVRYPAPGSREIAEEIKDVVKPRRVGLDEDAWGIDHGTWSVLVHAFPDADVPVLQLSIHALKDFDFHFELGTRLAPLRERGILVVGSGNAVHNLRALDWQSPDAGFDWNRRFDDAAREVVLERPSDAPSLRSHADFAQSHPTPEHFIPLLYFACLAHAAGAKPRSAEEAMPKVGKVGVVVDGPAFGSLSMASFALEAECPQSASDGRPSAPLPDPSIASPDDTNT